MGAIVRSHGWVFREVAAGIWEGRWRGYGMKVQGIGSSFRFDCTKLHDEDSFLATAGRAAPADLRPFMPARWLIGAAHELEEKRTDPDVYMAERLANFDRKRYA